MADRVAVAEKRAKAEQRLQKAVERVSLATNVDYVPPALSKSRFPDLYAAQLVESVADFIEKLGNNVAASQEKTRK